jgi:DNA ligase-1
MPRLPRNEEVGAVHHVVAQGNGRRRIVEDDRDRVSYLTRFATVGGELGWHAPASCLMDTHHHAVVETPVANLGIGMRRLLGGHSRWFNVRHGREGSVFAPHFWSRRIERDAWLFRACLYVVLNPVVAGLCTHPREWPWCSYRATAEGDPTAFAPGEERLLGMFGRTPSEAGTEYVRVVDETAAGIAAERISARELWHSLGELERRRGVAGVRLKSDTQGPCRRCPTEVGHQRQPHPVSDWSRTRNTRTPPPFAGVRLQSDTCHPPAAPCFHAHVLFDEVARASLAVAATSARTAKIDALAACLRRARPDEVPVAVTYLSGTLPRIGVGWASLRDLPSPAAPPPTLELLDVDGALARIAATQGPGSQSRRRNELAELFGRATEPEQRFLAGVLHGELRQGALEGVMVEAVASAAAVPAAEVRRALMLAGELPVVARAVLEHGVSGLGDFRLEVLRPVKPMLAQTADGVAEALERTGPAAVEWKLDGARLQVHRLGDEVRAFTRNLADVTDRVPEVVEAIGRLPLESAVLDGEVIALRPDGRPQPFQVTMGRFGSSADPGASRNAVPLSVFLFDCLHLDGDDLLGRPCAERAELLAARVPVELLVARIETDDPVAAEAFLEDALAHGHEGVMVKALDAAYEAGRRGAGWLKVKRAHTLDLVVLAAEWGHGRRQGKLSNLHLGARDPATGSFVMLGKTFKGMTDAMLAWQTEHLLGLETGREGHVVHVRPELVVEVAFDGVQASTRYPGGLALRFARVKGYRPDKPAAEADTIDLVRAVHAGEEGALDGPSGAGTSAVEG